MSEKPMSEKPMSEKPMSEKPMSEKPVYFWRETEGDSPWLSQWHVCPFYDDDYKFIYHTAEHYTMYQKALLFKDTAIAEQILVGPLPRDVKDLGRKVSGFDHKVWDEHKEQIVYRGNLLKVTKPAGGGDELLTKLLDTGDRYLVEASPSDRIWGIGFTAEDAEANRSEWGQNLLGKAWMKVREELRRDKTTGKKSDA